MLLPANRRLLLDILAPPEGFALDQAVGTTYSLDLLALLRVPLSATEMPWSEANGEPVRNPFTLLAALRRNAERISLFCHAGATKVPTRHIPLLTFLEGAVHPVTPPNPGGVFHPKVWLLRFTPTEEGDPVRYRLLVFSRNLTFDKSWDVALALDGELRTRRRGKSQNAPLAEFISGLPAMTRGAEHDLSAQAQHRVELLADEVKRVDWTPPDGFDQITFHPLGHDGRPSWPIRDLHRLLVISPFVHPHALRRLSGEVRSQLDLVGRFEELALLPPDALSLCTGVDAFDETGAALEITDEPDDQETSETNPVELSGLHAKIYAGERLRRAAVYVGSANATEAAFERNVEFLVELGGSRAEHGIDPLHRALSDSGLLTPFKASAAPAAIDEGARELERRLERTIHKLAAGALRAAAHPTLDGRWRTTLHWAHQVPLDALTLEARPLSHQTLRPVSLNAEPCCEFPPVGITQVTAFFALRITGRTATGQQALERVARLTLEGAPKGRAEAITAELLSDRDRLLRFLLALLATGGELERALDALTSDDPAPGPATSAAAPISDTPLLEPMLRTLHREPQRLAEVDKLLADLRNAAGPTAQLPADLEQLWATINAVRSDQAAQ
jgi:hypothetical protein